MKKAFKYYVVIWAALFVLFNVLAFVSAGAIRGGFTPSFWIGYVLIFLAFAGQLACGYLAFKEENLQKLFYNMSLITTSYTGLVVSFLIGAICMVVKALPYWVGAIACAIVLVWNLVSVMKASAAAEVVSKIDEKIENKTQFIRSLSVDANALLLAAKNEAVKAECKKVYEAIRYSDPMSHDALAGIESQIADLFGVLKKAAEAGDVAKVQEVAAEVVNLVGERNKQCRILK